MCEAEIHTIPKMWDELITTAQEKYWKNIQIITTGSQIFHAKQISIQISKNTMCELPYYGTNTGQY